MSLETARVALVAALSVGGPDVRELAALVLAELGLEMPSEAPRARKSSAERCRLWREEQKRKRAEERTLANTDPNTANAFANTPNAFANGSDRSPDAVRTPPARAGAVSGSLCISEEIQDLKSSLSLGGLGGTDTNANAPNANANTFANARSFGSVSPDPAAASSRRKPQTPATPPDDPVAWGAWCARWKLDARSDEVKAFANWHLGKDVRWRDWGRAWLDWMKKPQRSVAEGRVANGQAELTNAEKGARDRAENERRAIEGR